MLFRSETALAAKMDMEKADLRSDSDKIGTKRCFVSDGVDSFCELTELFLGHKIDKEAVELVEVI